MNPCALPAGRDPHADPRRSPEAGQGRGPLPPVTWDSPALPAGEATFALPAGFRNLPPYFSMEVRSKML
ncbi:hypothetical protein GCM10008939_08240 [Deinococcus aquiradiocola]|uniref:Uncharacterized protein n=1 Tax=Deinococcus aquiradiocola TaxID=393059 RepID=A0A917P8A3_9DEIO|nr:hypothetical protein GCM10008939_08240 [Deinococcus aquiradiocola]